MNESLLYRFKESSYSERSLMLTRYEFPVLKETTCGWWIDVFGVKKFVLATARKRYACPTVEEALESYRARKRRQIKILRTQLARAEAALKLKEHEREYYGFETPSW